MVSDRESLPVCFYAAPLIIFSTRLIVIENTKKQDISAFKQQVTRHQPNYIYLMIRVIYDKKGHVADLCPSGRI